MFPGRAADSWIIPDRASPQVLVDLGQELGEVEVAVAGLAGGFEVGTVPVAFFFGQSAAYSSRAMTQAPWCSW